MKKKTGKLISIITVLLLLISSIPLSAYGNNEQVSDDSKMNKEIQNFSLSDSSDPSTSDPNSNDSATGGDGENDPNYRIKNEIYEAFGLSYGDSKLGIEVVNAGIENEDEREIILTVKESFTVNTSEDISFTRGHWTLLGNNTTLTLGDRCSIVTKNKVTLTLGEDAGTSLRIQSA